MTSITKTLVDVSDMEATSSPASKIEVDTYFATDPNPGQLSINGKSLSTVFGIPMQLCHIYSIYRILIIY
ncbi:MAG: hypothetical protein CM15mP93_05590 [Thiotrichaceae bacterium]|nr:MAG: hypothetical protein CM15mP93_05590 [Thiotrichaceae bacterium]